MRLEGKVAVIVGAGQSPGEGIGNGRATVLRFAREGARILAVDRSLDAAAETAALVTAEGFECVPFEADVTREANGEGQVSVALPPLPTGAIGATPVRRRNGARRSCAESGPP
jgi:NAD(P)-dependent dehydrogenase (short-subunit alcohol dehydrogenase family)